jgi:hypothetical protein
MSVFYVFVCAVLDGVVPGGTTTIAVGKRASKIQCIQLFILVASSRLALLIDDC